ncbi:hypothetical protein J6590_106923 [Homalodisca vitripennis]|nr:hypothetical protein J6590_106923 [Homalodisca vitripennis]
MSSTHRRRIRKIFGNEASIKHSSAGRSSKHHPSHRIVADNRDKNEAFDLTERYVTDNAKKPTSPRTKFNSAVLSVMSSSTSLIKFDEPPLRTCN